MSFEVVDLAPRIGAEIRTDVSTLVDGSRANAIRHLLEDRGVLVFPEIDICDEDQVLFTKTLRQIVDEGETTGMNGRRVTW